MPAELNILVIHGPNLNLLGVREPEVYGKKSLEEINSRLHEQARSRLVGIEIFQSNHEGELVDKIQECAGNVQGILINPAAFTHTSVAIRDSMIAVKIPFVEVHLSNIYQRESFRQRSYFSDIAIGVISGFGADSYLLGFDALLGVLERSG